MLLITSSINVQLSWMMESEWKRCLPKLLPPQRHTHLCLKLVQASNVTYCQYMTIQDNWVSYFTHTGFAVLRKGFYIDSGSMGRFNCFFCAGLQLLTLPKSVLEKNYQLFHLNSKNEPLLTDSRYWQLGSHSNTVIQLRFQNRNFTTGGINPVV